MEKISVCITTFNEEKTIRGLLDSLIHQTKKPDEIIIVDGGSSDATREIIKKYKSIRLIINEGCSIAKGRNIAVEVAKHPIIAMTDAGCVADSYWLERISQPLKKKTVDVVAGFYETGGESAFQKSLSKFLGVTPEKFDDKFLPSTRSIAFTKKIWEKVGGFNEKLFTAEDTDFNYRLALAQARVVRVKNALVEWGIPNNLWDAFKKFHNYAKGDVETKILIQPTKGFKSHNIKIFFVFLRYYLGFMFLGLVLANTSLLPILILLVTVYFYWAFRKAGLWGIVIQLTADIAVMSGAVSGILLGNGFSQRHLR